MISEFFAYMKQRKQLINAFKLAGVYNSYKTDNGERKVYPTIHNVPNEKYNYYVFTLPNGLDPKVLKKNFYVFQQVFGEEVSLDGDVKRFKLTIRESQTIGEVAYEFARFKEIINKENIVFPIVCGSDVKGNFKIYDATNSPNLLIYGEPGSGKSSILHVILTTLIQLFPPQKLELYLADFKMSELNLYEGVKHVKSVSYMVKEFIPVLSYLKNELTVRGNLLKDHRVRHINKLPDAQKPPYIVLCVDEFIMINNDDVMAELLQIASLGRAYGIYLILSMQRPSHKILSTDVRGLLSVRMGFRTVDKRNAMIGETPGSEKISKECPGTFLLNIEELMELRSPYLNEEKTEAILQPYKSKNWKNYSFYGKSLIGKEQMNELKESDVFNDIKKIKLK